MDDQLELDFEAHMTDEEKGYHCPDMGDCSQCPYVDTLCIVFSSKGKKNYKAWLKKQQNNI